MSDIEVRIVKIEAMRVASARVVSTSPERAAWQKMRAWADPKGLLEDVEKHPVFSFNNPDPSAECQEYGCEFWIRIGPDIKAEGEIQVKDFAGGQYAVATCEVKGAPWATIAAGWQRLVDWVKSSKYEFGSHQALEKPRDPHVGEENLVLDLYCPIRE